MGPEGEPCRASHSSSPPAAQSSSGGGFGTGLGARGWFFRYKRVCLWFLTTSTQVLLLLERSRGMCVCVRGPRQGRRAERGDGGEAS